MSSGALYLPQLDILSMVASLISITLSSYNLLLLQQGVIIFHDIFDNERGGAQIRVEGVYVWPFRQLRMVAHRY